MSIHNHLKKSLIIAGVFGIPLLYLYTLLVIIVHPNSVSLVFPFILLGVVLACVGLIMWLISFFTLRKSFGVLPQRQKRVTTGIYKYFRHPMYVGIWLTFGGLSLANASWQGLVFTHAVLVPVLIIRGFFETRALYE